MQTFAKGFFVTKPKKEGGLLVLRNYLASASNESILKNIGRNQNFSDKVWRANHLTHNIKQGIPGKMPMVLQFFRPLRLIEFDNCSVNGNSGWFIY